MKKIILIFLLIVILALGGAAWYVSCKMDWNQHKGKLADELSSIIGRKIVFSGDLDVSLFPIPRLSAKDIEIINQQTSEKLAVIEQLETSVSLKSILKGTPDISSLSLSGVEVWFNYDKNNESNWQLKSDKKEASKAIKDVSFQSFNLKNSLVHINIEKYDVSLDLTNVNTDVQAASLSGPYRLDGNFMIDDDRYGLAFSIDSISQLEDTEVKFAITHPNSDSYVRYDGIFNIGSETFKGDFSGTSNNAADFINIVMNKEVLDKDFNVPLMFSSTVNSDEKEMNFSRLVIKFGEYLEGAGDIKVIKSGDPEEKDEIDVKYQLVELDLIPIENFIKEKLVEFRSGKDYIPELKFNFKYDLSAERTIMNSEAGGILENVNAKGTWKDGVLGVDEFYAAGAGNSVITFSGSLEEQEKKPHYFASVSAEGKNFLSLINSFGVDLTAPIQSAYHDGKLTFDIDGNSDNFKLSNIHLEIDKAEVEGEAFVEIAENKYEVKMSGNKLNLDNYISEPKFEQENPQFSEILQGNISQLSVLKDLKLKIDTSLKNIIFRKIPIAGLEFKAETTGDGELKVDNLTLKGVLESEINASGNIKNVATEPVLFDNLNYKIKSMNFQTAADKWRLKIPSWPLFKQRNFEIVGQLDGTPLKFNTETKFSLEDSSLIYKGSYDKNAENEEFDGNITLKTTRLENILKYIGIESRGANSLRGAFNAEAKIKGNPQACKISELNALNGGVSYKGDLEVKQEKGNKSFQGKIVANEVNLANWIRIQTAKTSRAKSFENDTFISRPSFDEDTFSYSGYRGVNFDIELDADKVVYKNNAFNKFHARISNEDSLLSIQDISCNDNDVTIKGSLEIDYKQSPKMKGKLEFGNINIDKLGGTVYDITARNVLLNVDFETSATSIAEMFDEISGTMDYSAENIDFKGINLAKIQDDLRDRKYSKGLYQIVHDNLQSGATHFNTAKGTVEMSSGAINIQPCNLKEGEISAVVGGTISLKDWKSDVSFNISYEDLQDVPEYSFTFSGALNRPNMDIHIENIAQKYDDYWRQVAENEEMQKNEETRVLNEKMGQAQQVVEVLINQNSSLQRTIEDKLAISFIEENKNTYNQYLAKTKEIATELAAMQSVGRQTEFNDEDINGITAKTPELKTAMDNLVAEVNSLSESDMRKKQEEITDDAKNSQAVMQKLNSDYDTLKQEKIKRLEEINAADKILQNQKINSLEESFKKDITAFNDNYASFTVKNYEINAAENTENRYNLIVVLAENAKDLNTLSSKISDNIATVITELENTTQQEITAYEEAKKAEAEANANNLLFTEAEDNKKEEEKPEIKVIESPQEPEKSNIEPEKVAAPVIKTEEVKKAGGKIVTSYDKVSENKETEKKPENSILRQVDGAVQKVSGIIKVK